MSTLIIIDEIAELRGFDSHGLMAVQQSTAIDAENFIVEKLVAKKGGTKRPEYLVKWQGYAACENTWGIGGLGQSLRKLCIMTLNRYWIQVQIPPQKKYSQIQIQTDFLKVFVSRYRPPQKTVFADTDPTDNP